MDSKADWISLAQARNAARRDNAKRLPELAPGATRIDAGAAAFEADAADAAVDVTQRAVPGKLYTYSQDGDEVVVEVKVPAETKSKDVSCVIKLDSISLSVGTLPEGQRDVMSGELFQVRNAAFACSACVRVRTGLRGADVCRLRVCGFPCVQRVQPEECSWTLASVGGERVLQVTLTKQKTMRWLGVLRSG